MPYGLQVDSPFNLETTLAHDQGHRWRPDNENPGWYTGVLGEDYVRIRQETTDGPLEFEPGTTWIEHMLRWQFRVGEDVQTAHTTLRQDARMAVLVDRFDGLRIMRVDPWECLVFFIISGHNHYQSRVPTGPTATSLDRIAERFWEGGAWAHDRYPFPRPEEVWSDSGLVKLQELWFKRTDKRRSIRGLTDMPRRVHEAARFIKTGRLDSLRSESAERAVSALRTLPGVGPKAAHCVALFGLGHMDAFPVDVHVIEGLLSVYGRDPFLPYAGYASQLLFLEGLKNNMQR